MTGTEITIWIALFAGLLSFISPCTLPLYPSYLSYITGISIQAMKEEPRRFQKTAMLHTLFFLLGFAVIIYALGLSATVFGHVLNTYRDLIRQLGAIFIVFMGLFMMGIIKFNWLMQEKRIHPGKKPAGFFGSFLIGIAFAAGWTPCIGPILAIIITLTINQPSLGLTYMTLYIIGFAVPFFLLTFFISKIHAIIKYSNLLMKIGGAIMVIMGILLYFNQLTQITIFFTKLFGGWQGF
ncbi:cytochrome c biogenesis CcdA family protein [Rubeoparvulum massiliense]|uniref:cytochrome c biogenesis CcdA family protein n=1 Tax=Rubeoparvulum massiliense TaxID=1631346 RepID=UPI00065E7F65|nr:cytochrome c biogenesis protein CcdA [Rubeoparvulum massiliense]